MKSKFNKSIFITISIIIMYFSVYLVFSKKTEFSENENRYLEEFPTLTVENLLNGNFTSSIQEYLGDHFPNREKFLFITTKLETFLGKKIIDNVYIGKDDYLLTKFDGLDNKDQIIKKIQDFSSKNSDKKIELLLIPSSISINKDKLPKFAISNSEIDEIQDIYNHLNIDTINVYNTLINHNSETAMFYKTDHHWTSYGAYYSYLEFCYNNGLLCTSISDYNINKVTSSFYGTLYSKTNKYDNKADDIYIFDLKDNNYTVDYVSENITKESIFEYSYLNKKDKYSMFLDNNHPLITITNKSSDNNNELLLIKDSYGNSFSQFLINDYYKVHIIDLRYYLSSVSKYIEEHNEITTVLLLYSINTLNEGTGILNLK